VLQSGSHYIPAFFTELERQELITDPCPRSEERSGRVMQRPRRPRCWGRGWGRRERPGSALPPAPPPAHKPVSSVLIRDPDPSFEIFAEADPDSGCEKFADPDLGFIFVKARFFFTSKKQKKNLGSWCGCGSGSKMRIHIRIEIKGLQKCGSNKDPEPKP